MSVQYYFVEEENASYKVLIIKYLNRFIELQKDSFAINVFSDEQLEEEWKMISHRAEISDIFLPIDYIEKCIPMSYKTLLTIMCSYLSSIDQEVGDLCIKISKTRHLSLAFISQIFYDNDYSLIWKNKRHFELFFNMDVEALENVDKPLILQRRIVSLLAGGRIIYKLPYSYNFTMLDNLPEYFGDTSKIDMLSYLLKTQGKRVVFLKGMEGSGRKFLLKYSSKKLNKGIIFIDWQRIKNQSGKERLTIVTEAIIQRSILCITNISKAINEEELIVLSNFIDMLAEYIDKLCVCVEEDININLLKFSETTTVEIDKLSIKDLAKLWSVSKIPYADDIDVNRLSSIYRFTPGKIVKIINQCENNCISTGTDVITKKQLQNESIKFTQDVLKDKATLLQSNFSLEDLVISDSEKRQIIEGINHVLYSDVVYDKWNFAEKFAYGKSMTMLFCGPPGTGKTMAASIISTELGIPAFRVDVSKIMSKYIGETEKNIGEIFDAASMSSAILFFDEMDALFGKRSEIRDSHDKYANIETSYLLQRIEQYDGICIMTTNLLQNIDEAFLRRISYIVNFSLPKADERLELWKKSFPKDLNVVNDIDYDFLAENFEISGAMIKNTVLQAAFLAASEKNMIGMKHILRALIKQMSKHGKNIMVEELGKYKHIVI